MEILKPIMEQCVLNQARGYWLLFNALILAICICMKLNNEFNHRVVQVLPFVYGTIDDGLEIIYG
jgi:hypothetical protein